ncbi:MAG TPA: PAS domain S-box protein, partial [Oligoflexia bacterium]|nr:PAS domain S-box protein [Oligoflexia bacterium]
MSASLSPAVEDGSEAQIREAAQFPEQNPSPVLRALADGTVLYANKPARAFLAASGWDPTQPLPEPLSNAVRQVLATGLNTELDFTSQNGTICSFVLAPISGAPYVNLYGRDVTEHRAREARIARLTRLYAVLSRVNESIFRTREPQPLFEEVCRILVKQGQFPLVIVGLPQDGALRLATAASLEQLPLTAAANLPEGFPWPGTIAGSFNEPIINNNLSPGDMPAPFAELAHRIGLGSSAFFPFRCHDQPSGVLMLYAAGRAAFDDEQLQLFTALASDVSLALEAMQHDKMRSVVAEALRNSEEQFRAMFELAAVGMAQVEAATGRYLRVNGRFCSMTGYTSAELLNMRFSDLTHHEDQEADWQLFQAALRGETPDYRNEKRYVRKDGSVCWVNVNATILRTASGAPFRTVAVIEDISERKDLESRREQYLSNLNTMVTEEAARRSAAEASLRKRSEILDAFFTHTTAPLAILDRAFNFIRVNGCYAAAAGRKPEEFTGHNHFELYPNAENQVIFQRVVASKIPYQALAKPFLFPDHPEWGITYWDWNLTPLLDDNGDVEFLVLALVDVTQREQTARRDAFTRSLLELFAQKPSRKEYLDSLVEALRSWSGAQCAAVRLVSTRDRIAYVSAAGFDSRFLAEENNLALHTENCICTRAATGTFAKHEQHLLTANRAFYCGNITQFYAALPEDMRADYRGACMAQRFSTIAVIPIRYRDELVGIIQLADERADVFSRCDTEFIESMTPLIAEAIHRFSIEEDLRTASLYFRTLLEASLDPVVTIKLDGLVQDVNRAAEAATGLSREQLIGRDFANCFTEPQNAREAFRNDTRFEAGERY